MNKNNDFIELPAIVLPYDFKWFICFLEFSKGDRQLIDAIDYIRSMQDKIMTVELCKEEFINQIHNYEKENEELEEKGIVIGIQNHLLIVKYETYLNSIYSLLESFAKIVMHIYNKLNLAWNFHRQLEYFTKKNRDVDKEYTKALESLTWYDEVRRIRDESNHFLSGLIINYQEDTPGYLISLKSGRKDTPKKIEIADIVEHVTQIQKGLYQFFEDCGRLFLEKIDKDVRISRMCGITKRGFGCYKHQSYNEMINNQPGICHTYKADCPKADQCEARKNALKEAGH